MGDVTSLHYPHLLPPIEVTLLEETEDGPLYDPTPDVTWTARDGMTWLAGVVTAELGRPVEIRAGGRRVLNGLYSLKLGDREPITGLDIARVVDILGGCVAAVTMLKEG